MRAIIILLICFGYLLIATLYPLDTSVSSRFAVREFLSGFTAIIPGRLAQLWTRDFFENIVLFIPLGILLYYALTLKPRPRIVSVLLLPVFGGLLSFAIELIQVFFPERVPQASDVLSNTLGAIVGGLLAACLPTKVPDQVAWLWAKVESSKILFGTALLYGMLPSFFSVVQFPWFNFRNWDARYTFQLANEATRNAPWLGKLYLAALYNRALTPAEIVRHFETGFSADALTGREQGGLVVLYTFDEGAGNVVHDLSTLGLPLDLSFETASHVRWLHDPQGIEMVKPAIIKSQGPATKLFSALTTTSALSIEVWMSPAKLDQSGPARIVAFSHDPFHNNFMLGQQGSDIHFQLRTPISGDRGSPANLKTNDMFLTTATFHIVATYDHGESRLYVNGRRYENSFDLAQDAIVGFYATKNPIAQIAYITCYFFPVSFLLSIYFSTSSRVIATTQFLPFVITLGLLSLTEIAQAFTFDRAIDLPLIGYGVLISMVGVFSGKAFASRRQVQPGSASCLPPSPANAGRLR